MELSELCKRYFLYFCRKLYKTMNVESIKEIIEKQPNLSTALGMEFISTIHWAT